MNQHDAPCNRWVIDKAVLPQHIVLEIKRDALGVPHTGVALRAKDQSIAEESVATAAGHVNADYFPARPSLSALDLEVDPCRPIEKSAMHDGRHWQVVEGCIAVVEIAHQCSNSHHGDGRYSNSDDRPEAGIHKPCLLLTQGDAGRLFVAAAPHTLILSVSIHMDEHQRPAVREEEA